MTKPANLPYANFRNGRLKDTIWKNQRANGASYSIDFTRTYTDKDGIPQDTNSFTQSDLLRVARLAGKASDLVSEAKS